MDLNNILFPNPESSYTYEGFNTKKHANNCIVEEIDQIIFINSNNFESIILINLESLNNVLSTKFYH